MDYVEKKKGNGLFIITIVLLLLVIAGLAFIVLKDKGMFGEKDDKKANTKEKIETKENSKKETTEVKDESKIIYSGENLREDKDFGKVVFGGKEVSIKYSNNGGAYEEGRLSVGDKYIDILSGSITNIAIMGDYLVIGIEQDGYRFELYDKDLKQVDRVGNSLGILSIGTKTDTSKLLIDENDLIFYSCTIDSDSSTNFRLDLYNLKIDGSKIEKILVGSSKGVNCTSQR